MSNDKAILPDGTECDWDERLRTVGALHVPAKKPKPVQAYEYRRGNGNDGDYPRFVVLLSNGDNPYAALRALVANDYIAGKRVRRWIVQNIHVDGEAEYGLHAVVYEGPNGETEFGAAWLTAQLNPLNADDAEYATNNGLRSYKLRRILDNAALRQYRAYVKSRR